eukprot:599693_1
MKYIAMESSTEHDVMQKMRALTHLQRINANASWPYSWISARMNEYDSFCCGGTAMLMHARRAIGTRKHAHARTYINYTNSCTAKCLYCCGTPYCCDEKAYSNPCAARCNGHKFINFKCKADICEGDERCNYPQKHEPVCCNNGTEKEEEYGNYCEANQAMCHEDACELSRKHVMHLY